MLTATGVATPNKPATEENNDLLEAAKALTELQGREEGDGDEKSTNAKNKNLMLMEIARFWMFHVKTTN